MKQNLKLLVAIRERGLKQCEFAKKVGEDPSIVSRIIRGVWNPNDQQKTRYARTLRKSIRDIFGD